MRLLDYIFFCRPMLLIPVWTVFLLLFARVERSVGIVFADILALTFFSALTAGAYVINQIFDRESDKLNNKLGFLEPPISIGVNSAWTLYAFVTGSALFYALLFQPSVIACYVAFGALGVLYSAPPLRAKDRPILGWLFNATSFSVIIGWLVFSVANVPEEYYWSFWLDVIALFFAISSAYLLTTIPDVTGDRASGKLTVATELGAIWTLMLGGLCSAAALSLAIVTLFWPLALSAGLSVALIVLAILKEQDSLVLLAIKTPILALTIGAVISFPTYGLFLVALLLLTRVYYSRRWGITYPSFS
ncbi:UbiA family prenyltransferase [Gemmatimonas aurantiaca]|nr:UbiA family prenyltransferase [Gemmatimonas aurantiaca]